MKFLDYLTARLWALFFRLSDRDIDRALSQFRAVDVRLQKVINVNRSVVDREVDLRCTSHDRQGSAEERIRRAVVAQQRVRQLLG